MFDDLIKQMKKLEKTQVTIPIKTDENGFIDKECPADNCKFQFKVDYNDWREKFKDENVWCPRCGGKSEADSYWTQDQIDHAHEQASNYVKGLIGESLSDGAKKFNRSQHKNAFIKMSISYKGTKHIPVMIPIPAMKELQQKITCSACGAKYAVLGSSFFCPCCGYDSVETTFMNSINSIKKKIGLLPTIFDSLKDADPDIAATTVTSIIESSLEDCVTVFQTYCEKKYRKLAGADVKIGFNAFQKIDQGSKLWRKLFNEGYSDWISNEDLEKMTLMFQQRHLLAHNDGFIDEKYIERSEDKTYKTGQRLVVKEDNVLNLVKIIEFIMNKIEEKATINK